MSESDRWVDLAQEGVDCALRYGKLRDSDMIGRRVALLERVTCATPAYLASFGTPVDIAALSGHRIVGLRSITTGHVAPLEFIEQGQSKTVVLPSLLSVTGTESYLAGIRQGLGLAQVPRFHIENDLKSGALVQVLESTPPPSMPVSIMYLRSRQLSPRVRVFLDWVAREFAKGSAVPME